MIKTNKTEQVDFILDWSEEMSGSHRDMKEFECSVTESLKDPTAIVLRRRHDKEIEEDLQESADRDAGTAVHESVEKHAVKRGYVCEKELQYAIELGDGRGFVLTGKIDCYNPMKEHMVDLKNTKLASYNKNARLEEDEWFNQQSLYTYLMEETTPVWFDGLNLVTIEARITDLSVVKERMAGNSTDKWRRIDWPMETIHRNIPVALDKAKENFSKYLELRNVPDEELPMCSAKYRFATTTYKIYKLTKDGKPSAKAERGHANYTSLEEAEEGFKKAGFTEDGYVINAVGGESIKCKYYCECRNFCPHYKKMMEATNEV